MRILHLSDTHGNFPELSEADIVVHSGDLLPNWDPLQRRTEAKNQLQWVRERVERFKGWLGGRPFYFVPGNHDFVEFCSLLRRGGVDAWDLWHDGVKRVDGLVFGGLPFVPWFGGDWNWEVHEDEIAADLAETMSLKPDVLVTHCPPYGVLDVPWQPSSYYANGGQPRHIGSTAIANMLYHGEKTPRLLLCGHCHEDGGKVANIGETRVVNSATCQQIVEV